MNQYARPGEPDQIEVARHGYCTRYAVLSAANADCNYSFGVEYRLNFGRAGDGMWESGNPGCGLSGK
ncbi:hypothetical protein B0G84_7608 [Paraburkholderia sp. BL8N3]|nr:hypothetical protein [Paraburkholderia sp. BL8N3]TCK33389.1 hypothetical protein B0G84_7608 [Paraburkholderia sp. BL8N3]